MYLFVFIIRVRGLCISLSLLSESGVYQYLFVFIIRVRGLCISLSLLSESGVYVSLCLYYQSQSARQT